MENITIIVVKPNSVKWVDSVNQFDYSSVRGRCTVAPLLPKSVLMPKVAEPNATQSKKAETSTLGLKCLSAGTAASIADIVTFPLDTTKVRLQVQGEALGGSCQYRGVIGTLLTVARQEGVGAWYQGLTAGLQRQMCFASIRIGLYDIVKSKYSKLFGSNPDSPHILVRMLAGMTTGGMAVLCAQPTDVVKTRLQAQRMGKKRYSGVIHAYRTIATQEGISGLWKGVAPNVARNSVVNVSELVSYDLIKDFILKSNYLTDNMPCHFVSATGAGLITTLFASPVDVVKTRFMNSTPGQYRGALHCTAQMYRQEGLSSFYKGCMPSFLRLTSWSIVMFVTYEQVKRALMEVNDNNSNNHLTDQLRPMFDRIPSLEDVLDIHDSSTRFV